MLINFDYDGVLVDSFHGLLGKACEAQKALGVGRLPTPQDFSTSTDLTFNGIARAINIPENRHPEFAAVLHQFMVADSGKDPMFPGISDVVRELARRHVVTVISANDKAAVERTLAQYGLVESVSHIFGGDEPGSKSEKISMARKRFNASSHETFMIGDAASDIREGKIAGVQTVAVTWGFQSRSFLAGESPDHLVDSPEDLLVILN